MKEVVRVKRFEHFRIDNPIYAKTNTTFGDLRDIMDEHNVTSVLIVDDNLLLKGLVTTRDWKFVENDATPVTKIMTPFDKLITGNPNVTLTEAKSLVMKNKIEKLPLVDKNGRIKGLITSHDIFASLSDTRSVRDNKGRLLVGAAIGIKPEDLERAGALIDAGCDVLVIDIAHGHSTHLIKALKTLKKTFPRVEVIAGNVASYEGTLELIKAGADAIKVGIGPGALCTTRIVTGAGVPQITAVMDSVRAASKYNIPLIADGGIRSSGDIVKALAAGASTTMFGTLFFAGCKESPALTFYKNGEKYKLVRGMASLTANKDRRRLDASEKNTLRGIRAEAEEYTAEGVEAIVRYKGSVSEILAQLVGGITSGFSYSGAHTIKELWKNAEFIKISHSALVESHPHDVGAI